MARAILRMGQFEHVLDDAQLVITTEIKFDAAGNPLPGRLAKWEVRGSVPPPEPKPAPPAT